MSELQQSLSDWFQRRHASGIQFQERFPSTHDEADDYEIIYEAIFEPDTLEKGRVEIWLTNEGNVSFGFETRDRVAARLSIRRVRRGFAAGHEPINLSVNAVLALVEAVSEGKLALRAGQVLGYLGRVRAVMSDEDQRILKSSGYGNLDWIDVTSDRILVQTRIGILSTLLPFHPW